MKEAFKIGGYAWHAHKRFEEIKKGWSFNKTVEWLDSVGIRFTRPAIRAFTNVYVTYLESNFPAISNSLIDAYALVNEQAENLTQLPDSKIQVMGNLFTALPSDDSTNPKELIRELIREGKMVFCFRRILPKQILKLAKN